MSGYADDTCELTGRDVWEAVKRGAGLFFFIGVAAAVGVFFFGLTEDRAEWESGPDALRVGVACLLAGTSLYVPLSLAVAANARRRGFLPGLLRFGHGLVVVVGVTAQIGVYAAVVLLRIARVVL